MKTKNLLTSLAAIAFVMPAMSETFPVDGYMKENQTYTASANYGNMGVYDGTVQATAEYENILYDIVAGEYLARATTVGTQCPSGSFCGGLQGATYDENNDQGITSCSTLENGAFPNSAVGASANTDCYRACTASDVAHATTVTGNDYYGIGSDTCSATGCEPGYHISDNSSVLLTAIGTTDKATAIAYNSKAGTGYNSSMELLNQYGLTEDGTFAVDFGNGKILWGKAQCSTVLEEEIGKEIIQPTLPDANGRWCYCRLDGYTLSSNGSMQSLSGPWVFPVSGAVIGSPDDCANSCAYYCALETSLPPVPTQGMWSTETNSDMRTILFNSLDSSSARCDANKISIMWSGASQADIDANNAGTVTYDGDIRTPRAAETVPGKTFKGWKFSKPQNGGGNN